MRLRKEGWRLEASCGCHNTLFPLTLTLTSPSVEDWDFELFRVTVGCEV